MIDLTNKAVATITDCDQEPIHIPGSIQPHGYLLAIEPGSGRITHGSANLTDLLGVPLSHLLGQSVFEVLPLQEQLLRPYLTLKEDVQAKTMTTHLGSRAYQLALHQSDAQVVLEIEPLADEKADAYLLGISDLLDLIKVPNSLTELCQILAEHVRKILEYDRIMIYRFDQEDYTGEVLAESLTDGLEPYLGLRYPAGDIPPQARELYIRNPLRSINDVSYIPTALYTLADTDGTARQLDLSHAYLRSVSPIHIQYLKNMGVAASLSISIIKEDKLWGLIACHHSAPRHISPKQRDSAQLLGLLLASQIELHQRADSSMIIQQVEQSLNRLMPFLQAEPLDLPGLVAVPDLLSLAGASGVAILVDGRIHTSGQTPTSPELRNLALFLAEQSGYASFSTKHLTQVYSPAEAYADVASGLIYQPLGYVTEDCVLWFRPGLEQTITWAGQPKGSARATNAHESLTPRSSFAAWKETVRNISENWHPSHLQASEHFASVFQKQLRLLYLQQETDKQRNLNEKLKAANDELENITWISMHDLKEPLRKIQILASRVLSTEAQNLTDSLLDSISRMQNSARRMQNLLEDITAYSRISSKTDAVNAVDLNQLLAEVLDEMEDEISQRKALITYGELPTLKGIAFQLKQVFVNLISNALKFGKPDEDLRIQIELEVPSAEVVQKFSIVPEDYLTISVQDNGIGFENSYTDVIFKLFQRLHNENNGQRGTGVGLAICKKVMQNHDGYIWADSEPNQGSRFQLIFPHAYVLQEVNP
ncbi:ATP-binding protein [Rhabdobacter roseus]|uniref:histidine kinase n=1 Tax=Rhabdobacter roseus TaxID=1655419 RepID=A0A840TSA9_9BACT|nr:ATP-binding protein [Rhabdobacter roseus]MBB5282838.1 light-regulated signal transduction histidine kinase (bacteriophytochrome) [Rhabdobacter roseus]